MMIDNVCALRHDNAGSAHSAGQCSHAPLVPTSNSKSYDPTFSAYLIVSDVPKALCTEN